MIEEEIKGINLEEEFKKEEIPVVEVTNSQSLSQADYKMPIPSNMEETNASDLEATKDLEKTALSKRFDEAIVLTPDELKSNTKYSATIRAVKYLNDSYPTIAICYIINDDGTTKTTVDEFSFGGNFDDYYLKKLVGYIKRIKNYPIDLINSMTYQTIADSMQFLVSAKVSLTQKEASKGKTYNEVTILGKYDADKKTMVD
ncbi:MAG: hypothetical protein IKE75_04790 [Bacilli bacterium]|nr:hypothetical protein [Bacilli bacterium]